MLITSDDNAYLGASAYDNGRGIFHIYSDPSDSCMDYHRFGKIEYFEATDTMLKYKINTSKTLKLTKSMFNDFQTWVRFTCDIGYEYGILRSDMIYPSHKSHHKNYNGISIEDIQALERHFNVKIMEQVDRPKSFMQKISDLLTYSKYYGEFYSLNFHELKELSDHTRTCIY